MKIRNMRKFTYIFVSILLLSGTGLALAYIEDYPPYKFGNNHLHSLDLSPIIGFGSDEVTVRVGEFMIQKRKNPQGQSIRSETLVIKKGNKTLIRLNGDEDALLICDVYYYDFDGNKMNDFLIVRDPMGNGLGGAMRIVQMFLQEKNGNFRRIEFDTYMFQIGDFIDPGMNGNLALMILDMSHFDSNDKKGHSFWIYSLYEFDDLNLKRVKESKWGFPKFIWYTNNPNDKITEKLTLLEKSAYLKGLPEIIRST